MPAAPDLWGKHLILILLCWWYSGCLQPLPEPSNEALATEAPPFPALLAREALSDESAFVIDVALDAEAGFLYVIDSTDHLHKLDADTLKTRVTRAVLPGFLRLDVNSQRLYIEPQEIYLTNDLSPQIQVIDLERMDAVGTVPGRYLTVDPAGSRLFTGVPLDPAGIEQMPILVFNEFTLALENQLPITGIPLFNPLRNELLVMAYTTYVVDPATGKIVADLAPDLSSNHERWLVGSPVVSQVQVDVDKQIIRLDIGIYSAGAGPGTLPPPHLFDARTLDPITARARRLRLLNSSFGGQIYEHSIYSRYVTFHNWTVYDLSGKQLRWHDGFGGGHFNPNSGQLYRRGDVVDLAVGRYDGAMPDVDLKLLDVKGKRLYATQGSQLLLFAESGGKPLPPSQSGPAEPPANALLRIFVSPTYAEDHTLFVQIEDPHGGVYRTQSQGRQWMRLAGGLPRDKSLAFAFSPAFASDETVFAAGSAGTDLGYGILRSSDGGLTWSRLWDGLTHLRTEAVALSPSFPRDRTLAVRSSYYRVEKGESGRSVFLSEDAGLHWSLIYTATADQEMPILSTLLPEASKPQILPLRTGETSWLERTDDEREKWEEVTSLRVAEPFQTEILASPAYHTNKTIYLRSDDDIWRTVDAGLSWQVVDWLASGVELPTSEYGGPISTWALSPPLANGSYLIFLGTVSGELLALHPEDLIWTDATEAVSGHE